MAKINCPNCGAVRTGTVCEYCGTQYGVDLSPDPDTAVISVLYADNIKVYEAFADFQRTVHNFGGVRE